MSHSDNSNDLKAPLNSKVSPSSSSSSPNVAANVAGSSSSSEDKTPSGPKGAFKSFDFERDNKAWHLASEELGPIATLSAIALRAQEIKEKI